MPFSATVIYVHLTITELYIIALPSMLSQQIGT